MERRRRLPHIPVINSPASHHRPFCLKENQMHVRRLRVCTGRTTSSEALTNTAKQARASDVRVEVEVAAEVLRVAVRDDGTGGADLGRPSRNQRQRRAR
jgi:glucose-6-phosphate-specific signal transduction histidine kinase